MNPFLGIDIGIFGTSLLWRPPHCSLLQSCPQSSRRDCAKGEKPDTDTARQCVFLRQQLNSLVSKVQHKCQFFQTDLVIQDLILCTHVRLIT